jgi:hypothetical protein
MHDLNHSQQQALFNPNAARAVTVIGAGSVGSHVVLMLAKLGVTDITVVDADHVESHNLPMSVYGLQDLAKYKTSALAMHVEQQTGVVIKWARQMYAGGHLKGTVVACVDNMETRMLIWKQVRKNPLVDIFVDTRTAEELISVFGVNPNDDTHIAYYEHHLYPTAETINATCGRHGIIYVSAVAAALACVRLTRRWSNGTYNLHTMGTVDDFLFVGQ